MKGTNNRWLKEQSNEAINCQKRDLSHIVIETLVKEYASSVAFFRLIMARTLCEKKMIFNLAIIAVEHIACHNIYRWFEVKFASHPK